MIIKILSEHSLSSYSKMFHCKYYWKALKKATVLRDEVFFFFFFCFLLFVCLLLLFFKYKLLTSSPVAAFEAFHELKSVM